MAVRRKALLAVLWGFCWPGLAAVPLAPPPAPSPTAAELAPEIPSLRRLCAPLWGDLSPECLAALDRVYMDRDVTANWHSDPEERPSEPSPPRTWWLIAVEDHIVWRDVFGDPLALRIAVAQASTDSQCHAGVGDAPHHLREDCAADAFARLSVLRDACDNILYWDRGEGHDWAETWSWARRTVDKAAQDADDHALRTAALDESELHIAWRLRRCRAVPSAALDRVVAVRISPFEFHQQSQWWELRIIAARLGSRWANVRLSGPPAEINATAKSDLALAYVRRAGSEGPRHLVYLLAAREYDSGAPAHRLDWRGLDSHFSQTAIDRARPAVARLLRDGWRPMEEQDDGGVTSPWAIAPPVLETRFIRRRVDEDGRMRWVYEDGYENWMESNGFTRLINPDGSDWGVFAHSQLSDRRRPKLRTWMDEHGRPRWLDYHGVEHWIDADGAEHWITFGGTEWILLPPDNGVRP